MRVPPFRRRSAALIFAATLAVVGIGPVAAAPVSTPSAAPAAPAAPACSSGVRTLSQFGDRVYPDQGNGGYTSVHTDLFINYDTLTNMFLPGTRADLTIRSTQCLTDFSFDFERTNPNAAGPNMTVSAVLINGAPAPFDFRQPTYPGNPNGPDDPDPLAHAVSNVNPVSATNPNPPACSPSVSGNSQNGTQCPANKLVITPAVPIPDGTTLTVSISYSGRPGVHIDGDGSAEGWFRVNTTAAPNDGSFVTTEPVGSMAWMPLNNHPTAKPTYDIYDTVPIGKTAIGPGHLVGATPGPTFAPLAPTAVNPPDANFPLGSWSWHWHSPEGIANYLVTNSIGSYDLTAMTSPTSGIEYYQALASGLTATRKAAIKVNIDQLESMIEFQKNYAGPYPFTTAGVIVALPSVGFAEEMQTKITFGNGASSTPSIGTLHHEAFHQWFGDNVAEAGFRLTFWKEGWATVGEYLNAARTAANAAGGLGTPAGDAAFDTSLINRFNTNYNTTSSTAWTSAPSNPTVGNLFSTASTYTRPGTTYLALRQILGATASNPAGDRWIGAMKQIQTQYGGGNITEQQLEDVFHQWLPNQSVDCHARLNQFFTQWFDTAYPQPNNATNKPQITGPGLAGGGFYDAGGECIRADQTIMFDPLPNKTYGDSNFTVSATASSGLPVSFSASGQCTISGSTVHVTTVGSCTITADQGGNGFFKPAPSAPQTFSILPAPTTTTASLAAVAPNPTPQFSDTATVTASVAANATTFGDGVFSGTVAASLNGIALGSAPVSNAAPAANFPVTLGSLAIPAGAGNYDIVATFTPATNSNYATSTTTQSSTVRREGQGADDLADGSAQLSYAGDQFVLLTKAPNLVATLQQSLAPEAGDAEYVDYSISDVYVAFDIYPDGVATPVWTSPNVKVGNRTDWATTGTGFAQTTGPADLAEDDYSVVARVVPNGYILADDDTVTLAVASPVGPFISGGGFIAPDSTANAGKGKGQFSFNVKSDKKDLKGKVTYRYKMRMDVPASTATNIVPCATKSKTCRDVDIIIKSSALNGLNTGTTLVYPMTGYATGAASVEFRDGKKHLTQFEFSGGTFRLDIVDAGPGTPGDTFGFTAYRQDGSVYHVAAVGPIAQTGTGAPTNQVTLGGGNVVVHPK